MNLLDHIYWIVKDNDSDTLQPLSDEQFKKLLDLLYEHKLILRFYNKVELFKPVWMTLKQKYLLKLLYNKLSTEINSKLLAITELSNKAKEKNIRCVIIKGLTTYFLTDDTNNLRGSSDIDILCDDHQALINLLLELGYTEVEKIYPEHEIVSLYRNDIEIDVHKFLPSYEYHPSVKKNARSIKRTNRTWFFSEKDENYYYSSKLDYDQIVLFNHNGINLPNINMHVLIICINAFRSYVHSFYHKTSGICISDLLEVKSLITHKRFNAREFHNLVKKHSAEDAVRFVSILLQHFFKLNFSEQDNYKNFPFKLTWLGVWAIPRSIDFLLFRSFDELNYWLYPVLEYNTKEKTTIKDLNRNNSHIAHYIKEVRQSIINEVLSIRLVLPHLVPWVKDFFVIRLAEEIYYEWNCSVDSYTPVLLNDDIKINYIIFKKFYAVEINIPLASLRNNSLIIIINRVGGIGVNVTYIPILLKYAPLRP